MYRLVILSIVSLILIMVVLSSYHKNDTAMAKANLSADTARGNADPHSQPMTNEFFVLGLPLANAVQPQSYIDHHNPSTIFYQHDGVVVP